MLEENTHSKQSLKHSCKSGPQLVTISNVSVFKNKSGEVLTYRGKQGIVVTFKNDDIEHEELYWLTGYRYAKFLKLIRALGILGDNAMVELPGKKLWIVIRHNVTINNHIETMRQAEIIDFSVGEKMPNYPLIIAEYDIASVN